MVEEIDFENRHFWNFKSHVTLTLTSDDLESDIIVNVSSTLTNSTIWFVASLCLIVDVRTYVRTFLPGLLGHLRRWPKNDNRLLKERHKQIHKTQLIAICLKSEMKPWQDMKHTPTKTFHILFNAIPSRFPFASPLLFPSTSISESAFDRFSSDLMFNMPKKSLSAFTSHYTDWLQPQDYFWVLLAQSK